MNRKDSRPCSESWKHDVCSVDFLVTNLRVDPRSPSVLARGDWYRWCLSSLRLWLLMSLFREIDQRFARFFSCLFQIESVNFLLICDLIFSFCVCLCLSPPLPPLPLSLPPLSTFHSFFSLLSHSLCLPSPMSLCLPFLSLSPSVSLSQSICLSQFFFQSPSLS